MPRPPRRDAIIETHGNRVNVLIERSFDEISEIRKDFEISRFEAGEPPQICTTTRERTSYRSLCY